MGCKQSVIFCSFTFSPPPPMKYSCIHSMLILFIIMHHGKKRFHYPCIQQLLASDLFWELPGHALSWLDFWLLLFVSFLSSSFFVWIWSCFSYTYLNEINSSLWKTITQNLAFHLLRQRSHKFCEDSFYPPTRILIYFHLLCCFELAPSMIT